MVNPLLAHRKGNTPESGQVLLVSILLGLVLLIGITVVVFVNQTATLHQTARSQAAQGEGVAELGINYAIQELSQSSATWSNALSGLFPADCNSGHAVDFYSGSQFKLYCTNAAAGTLPLQNYQVAVTAVALNSKTAAPVRAVQAILSKRTLGADLANNIHAAAALQMIHQPSIGSSAALNVHWGPIVCLDAAQDATNTLSIWTLPPPIEAGQYPRKFSVGGLTGPTFARSGAAPTSGLATDQKEYWAYAPVAAPPQINESAYIQFAQNETVALAQPTSKSSGAALAPTGCVATNPTNCGYFNPTPGDTAVFGSGYTATGGAVIYVNGSAELDQISMDGVTFIVTGALYINDSSGGNPLSLHVPVTAASEYPYSPASQPCQAQQTCLALVNVQFRGFLYVKGNMFVNAAGWTMAGALIVGDEQAEPGTSGMLVIPGATGPANSSLTLYYDDNINHAILVQPSSTGAVKLEPDSMREVPAF